MKRVVAISLLVCVASVSLAVPVTFTTKPTVKKKGGKVGIGFAVSGKTDVTMSNCTLYSNRSTTGVLYLGDDVLAGVHDSIISHSLAGPAYGTSGSRVEVGFTGTDLYANQGGDWVGGIAEFMDVDCNFSADPVYCSPVACGGLGADLHLAESLGIQVHAALRQGMVGLDVDGVDLEGEDLGGLEGRDDERAATDAHLVTDRAERSVRLRHLLADATGDDQDLVGSHFPVVHAQNDENRNGKCGEDQQGDGPACGGQKLHWTSS